MPSRSCLQSAQSLHLRTLCLQVPSPLVSGLQRSARWREVHRLTVDILTLCWPCQILSAPVSPKLPRSCIVSSNSTMLTSYCKTRYSKSRHGTQAPPAARNMRKAVQITHLYTAHPLWNNHCVSITQASAVGLTLIGL